MSLASYCRGWWGEAQTAFGLWLFLGKPYRRFSNVTLAAPHGTTQIDHVVLSPFGVFVIETKNMNGWIYGSAHEARWTQVFFRQKHQFQNPLRQNHRHTRALAELLHLDDNHFHSIIWFIGGCQLKTELPPNVLTRGLIRHIKQQRKVLLTDDQVAACCAALQQHALPKSRATRNQHLASLRDRYASDTTCPKCGGELVGRTARKGGNAGSGFLGCSNFPRCRFVKAGG